MNMDASPVSSHELARFRLADPVASSYGSLKAQHKQRFYRKAIITETTERTCFRVVTLNIAAIFSFDFLKAFSIYTDRGWVVEQEI